MKKDRSGNTIRDYKEYEWFLGRLDDLEIPIYAEVILYCRDELWEDQPCEICGGNTLIHGVGRYFICNPDVKPEATPIFLCGYCTEHLKVRWGINLEFD